MVAQDAFNLFNGYWAYFNRKSMPKYIREQVMYRMMLCKSCVKLNICPHCKCKSPHLFFSSSKVDKLGK
jgi:hypothetical protein